MPHFFHLALPFNQFRDRILKGSWCPLKIEKAFLSPDDGIIKVSIMGISIVQLNQLADHFGFDVNAARAFLGIPADKKRGCPSKSDGSVCSGGKCKMVSVDPHTMKSPKIETSSGGKRGKTGYQLFVTEHCSKITNQLKQQLNPGEKLPRGAALNVLGTKWKALGDDEKKMWNTKAAKM